MEFRGTQSLVKYIVHMLNQSIRKNTWWRHQMETFSALLAICAGNSPVPGEFPAQRPVTRSFDVFFDMRLNKRLSKQSWGWWFETLSRPLWRHCNVIVYVCSTSHTLWVDGALSLRIVSEDEPTKWTFDTITTSSLRRNAVVAWFNVIPIYREKNVSWCYPVYKCYEIITFPRNQMKLINKHLLVPFHISLHLHFRCFKWFAARTAFLHSEKKWSYTKQILNVQAVKDDCEINASFTLSYGLVHTKRIVRRTFYKPSGHTTQK